MKSTTNTRFSQIPRAEIPRSSFDRSYGLKTTFDAGQLIPIFVDEALPGDTFNLKMTAFARLATPLKPIMDNIFLETFFFAVPTRLVWDKWQRFNGEQPTPGDSTDFTIPQMVSTAGTGYLANSIHDYLGLPTLIPGITHSALFHRAYSLIWNEWFRDQNLQIPLVVSKGDGPDLPATYFIKNRGKRHDYFTSCLPWPQKAAAVEIPIGGIVPVTGTITAAGQNLQLRTATSGGGSTRTMSVAVDQTPARAMQSSVNEDSNLFLFKPGHSPTHSLSADLATATAVTINDLRLAFQTQRLYERDARGGTRYTEILKSHFGVTSDDARLQRPEYLGGGSSPLNINEVAQTAMNNADTQGVGTLGGFGTSTLMGHGFSKSFTEHCILIGLVCSRADLTYQHGLPKMFSRNTRFDFYWPALAQIGEQAVLNQEIFTGPVLATNALVFGYQERYAEYRYKPSQITGIFRSNHATSLDIWHVAQDFADVPLLNSTFIEENPPFDRIIAVPAEPHFLFDSYTKLICARPMPTYGVPGLIDHF